MLGGCRPVPLADESRSGMSNRRRRYIQKLRNRTLYSGIQKSLRAHNIGTLVILPIARNRDFRSGMHNAVHSHKSLLNNLSIIKRTANLLETRAYRIWQQRCNTRITALEYAHIIPSTQQRDGGFTTEHAACAGNKHTFAATGSKIRFIDGTQRPRRRVGIPSC